MLKARRVAQREISRKRNLAVLSTHAAFAEEAPVAVGVAFLGC